MGEQRLGTGKTEGLSGTHLDLVTRYVAEAQGPPPRSPLRFWIDGEWVEMPSHEPEPSVHALVAPAEPESAAQASLLPVEPEQAPTPPSSRTDTDMPDLLRELDLPVYRWVQAAAGESDPGAPEPDWPRALVRGSERRARSS